MPLCLVRVGPLLYGQNDTFWSRQLVKLTKILPPGICQTLKLSYEALDDEEQQIFLDIAGFLVGENKDTAIRIWDANWSAEFGFQNLESRCLVQVDNENNIHMHDQLKVLGRCIEADAKKQRCELKTHNIDDLLRQLQVSVQSFNFLSIGFNFFVRK